MYDQQDFFHCCGIELSEVNGLAVKKAVQFISERSLEYLYRAGVVTQ